MSTKRIAVVCTARPSWSKLSPVVAALQADPVFDVDLIWACYALTHDRGGVVDPSFRPTTTIISALDANSGESSALTTGLLTMRLAGHFATTRPDAVMVNHDRHETLAVSVAAAYQNITLIHIGGGERSGNLDDKVRYANTALADWHFVANLEAYSRVINAGGYIDRVWATGCPSIDLCRLAHQDDPVTWGELNTYGTGTSVDPTRPFTLIMQHPVTDHPETAIADFEAACALRPGPQIVLWPGADTGHDALSKHLRAHPPPHARLVRSLPPRRFLKLLSQASYAVGNSSALIREASYFGVPRTIVGDRQRGRAWTLAPSSLYGDGHATPRIVELCRRACG